MTGDGVLRESIMKPLFHTMYSASSSSLFYLTFEKLTVEKAKNSHKRKYQMLPVVRTENLNTVPFLLLECTLNKNLKQSMYN